MYNLFQKCANASFPVTPEEQIQLSGSCVGMFFCAFMLLAGGACLAATGLVYCLYKTCRRACKRNSNETEQLLPTPI